MGSLIASVLLMLATLTVRESLAQGCGTAPLNTISKIVGGVNATAGFWPWQVSLHLQPYGFHICGGTLINEQWVMTAAHCIANNTTPPWTIFLGRETQSGPNVNEVSRTLSKIIVHPDWNYTLINNDIALMKLSSPVNFTDYIRPICLASSSSQFHNGTYCYSTGWGKLTNTTDLPTFTPLQQVRIPVIGPNQCSCSYASIGSITDQMICAGEANKGACQGDSGGPLQCQQGGMWIQAGVTSFGVPCARPEYPEVYARVSEFEQWIADSVMGTNVSFVLFNSNGTDPDNNFNCTSSAPLVTPGFVLLSTVVVLQHMVT